MLGDALLVIDLQNGVCHQNKADIYQLEQLRMKVSQRIARYTAADHPVIFVQHENETLLKGSAAWQLIPEIPVPATAYFVAKMHANSFFQTPLNRLLQNLKVTKVELCGAQSEYCIDATVKFAHGLGYQLLMSHQMTTTWDNEFMSAAKTIAFYEKIWDRRFLQFVDSY
ncbi:cysteine hydrolase family protein [Liquorilactobacillus capillatus]|uniref:Isochorismatase hydrolase n=1 Tax=Liquorilactobacillus capillatus DSM 19910 TaxID=1423731 RepID=A0A0R1M7T3_9LACO|nr:cysteine hydrolase family protein [Liquorilactobacillus capillatus]KRL01109.1 isochorismatase hydrolase [Liquorilactobacillus capillatus DSM 19910]